MTVNVTPQTITAAFAFIGAVVGKMGVLSYCGRIPDYVVEHLGAKSIVHCNHMG